MFVVLLIVTLDLARPAAATAHGAVFDSWVAEVPEGSEAAEKLASELGLRSLGQVRWSLLHTCCQ